MKEIFLSTLELKMNGWRTFSLILKRSHSKEKVSRIYFRETHTPLKMAKSMSQFYMKSLKRRQELTEKVTLQSKKVSLSELKDSFKFSTKGHTFTMVLSTFPTTK